MKDFSAVRKATDNPLLVAALFALAFALFLPYSFHLHPDLQRNPTAYVNAGEMLCDRTKTPPNLILYPHTVGYDGQFYYRLALNPFTTRQIDFGMKIDDPPYRQQRILYPLLVWMLSGRGHWQAVPWVMLFVNWACLALMGWMAGRLMQRFGQHALWGALLIMYPGFVITYRFDLTEILAATFLMASWLTLQQNRFHATMLLLACAALARETTLIFAFALLANNLYARYRRQPLPIPDYCWLVPLATYTLWQFTLLRLWGHLPSEGGRHNFGVPVIGMVHYLVHLLHHLRLEQTHAIDRQDVYFIFEEFAYIGIVCVTAGFVRASRVPRYLKFAWLFYTLLIFSLSYEVWNLDWSWLRAGMEAFLLSLVILLTTDKKARLFLAALLIVWWLFQFKARA